MTPQQLSNSGSGGDLQLDLEMFKIFFPISETFSTERHLVNKCCFDDGQFFVGQNLMKLPWGMVQKRTGEALRLKNEKFIKIPISFSFSHSSWFFASFERGSRETTFIHIAPYHAYHLPLSKIPSCRPTHWAFKVAAFKAMKHMIRLVKTCQLLSWSACLSWHLQKWVVKNMMDLMIVLQFCGFVFFCLAEAWKKKHLITRKRHICCFQGFQDSNIFPWACPKLSQRPCAISSVPIASLLAM